MASVISTNEIDKDLFERVKLNDDRQAFAEIFNKHWENLINSAAQRVSSIELAEEIVQQVFVDLYSKRAQIVIESNLEAYLKTAVKFQVFKSFRQQQVRTNHQIHVPMANSQKSDEPDLILESKQLREEIFQLSEQLPKMCREVFILSRMEQLSNRDISLQLDISVSMVRKHITKSMNFMRANFLKQHMDVLKFFILASLIL